VSRRIRSGLPQAASSTCVLFASGRLRNQAPATSAWIGRRPREPRVVARPRSTTAPQARRARDCRDVRAAPRSRRQSHPRAPSAERLAFAGVGAARPLARRERAALPLRVDLLRTRAALFTRRPGPAVRGSASVETNEQARHPAFDIGVGRSTHEKVGVDGGIGHLLLGVFFRFAMRYGGLQ
jgi:hypothetical protein